METADESVRLHRWKYAPHFIYVLVDPRDGGVRYVGCTSNPSKRLHEHITKPLAGAMSLWIADITQCGLQPVLRVVDHAEGRVRGWYRERDWIGAYSLTIGRRLLNEQFRTDFLPLAWFEKDAKRFSRWQRHKSKWDRLRQIWALRPIRQPRLIEHNGKSMTIAKWASELGLSRQALHLRLKKYPPFIALLPRCEGGRSLGKKAS